MLVLLDESLPKRLRRELRGYEVLTVQQQQWSGITNGELLRTAQSAHFEAFITADQNLQHQQNLSSIRLRIIVLDLPSNRFAHVRLLVPAILTALSEMQPGELLVLRRS
ncbi:MAG: DUF5615 family PIN-like protein [Thermoanaerobaculia bacterium]